MIRQPTYLSIYTCLLTRVSPCTHCTWLETSTRAGANIAKAVRKLVVTHEWQRKCSRNLQTYSLTAVGANKLAMTTMHCTHSTQPLSNPVTLAQSTDLQQWAVPGGLGSLFGQWYICGGHFACVYMIVAFNSYLYVRNKLAAFTHFPAGQQELRCHQAVYIHVCWISGFDFW